MRMNSSSRTFYHSFVQRCQAVVQTACGRQLATRKKLFLREPAQFSARVASSPQRRLPQCAEDSQRARQWLECTSSSVDAAEQRAMERGAYRFLCTLPSLSLPVRATPSFPSPADCSRQPFSRTHAHNSTACQLEKFPPCASWAMASAHRTGNSHRDQRTYEPCSMYLARQQFLFSGAEQNTVLSQGTSDAPRLH